MHEQLEGLSFFVEIPLTEQFVRQCVRRPDPWFLTRGIRITLRIFVIARDLLRRKLLVV